ncbi:exodeoxyribonuclease VII large subunit, partial [Methylobacterium symbioticum]|uniref:exodeoxyribonuclease VII large subunit n=1 Tax=Methylobacterium symbioticum TaxID=2584084 RepID=UPI001628528E
MPLVPPPPPRAARPPTDAPADVPPSRVLSANQPEWSVGELATALKRTLEDAFGHVRLRGEISGYRGPHGSGHAYFSLKDGQARIDAVVWKGVFGRLPLATLLADAIAQGRGGVPVSPSEARYVPQ